MDLALKVSGAGPTVVLVHGFTGSKEDYTYVAPALGKRFRVVSFDHRGHGSSPKPAGREHYTLDALTADLAGIVDAYGAVHLVGHSMGGVVVQRFLAAHPAAPIERVVLFDTLHVGGPAPDLERRIALAEEGGMAAVVAADALSAQPNPVLDAFPDVAAFVHNRLLEMSGDAFIALGRELIALPDTRPALAEIAVPVLVLCGERDTSTTPAMNRSVAAAFPHGRYEEIPHSGHSPQVENVAGWLGAVLPFLSS